MKKNLNLHSSEFSTDFSSILVLLTWEWTYLVQYIFCFRTFCTKWNFKVTKIRVKLLVFYSTHRFKDSLIKNLIFTFTFWENFDCWNTNLSCESLRYMKTRIFAYRNGFIPLDQISKAVYSWILRTIAPVKTPRFKSNQNIFEVHNNLVTRDSIYRQLVCMI